MAKLADVQPLAAAAPSFDDAYLSLRELAKYSGMSVRQLQRFIVDRLHPLPHYRFRSKVSVRRSEFDAWAREHCRIAPVARSVDEQIAEKQRQRSGKRL